MPSGVRTSIDRCPVLGKPRRLEEVPKGIDRSQRSGHKAEGITVLVVLQAAYRYRMAHHLYTCMK